MESHPEFGMAISDHAGVFIPARIHLLNATFLGHVTQYQKAKTNELFWVCFTHIDELPPPLKASLLSEGFKDIVQISGLNENQIEQIGDVETLTITPNAITVERPRHYLEIEAERRREWREAEIRRIVRDEISKALPHD